MEHGVEIKDRETARRPDCVRLSTHFLLGSVVLYGHAHTDWAWCCFYRDQKLLVVSELGVGVEHYAHLSHRVLVTSAHRVLVIQTKAWTRPVLAESAVA